jgi:hypothetical protein
MRNGASRIRNTASEYQSWQHSNVQYIKGLFRVFETQRNFAAFGVDI